MSWGQRLQQVFSRERFGLSDGAGRGLVLLALLGGCAALLAGLYWNGVRFYDRTDLLAPAVIGVTAAAVFCVAWPRGWPTLGICLACVLTLLFGLGPVAALGLTLATALSLGLIAFRAPALPDILSLALRLAAGLAILVGLLQIAMHFRINWFPLYFAGAVAAMLGARRHFGAIRRAWMAPPDAERWSPGRIEVGLLAVLAGGLVALTAHGVTTETGYDALSNHSIIVNAVQWQGRWHFDPALFDRSLMPRGAGWLFSWAQILGGEPATKLLNAAAWWLTVALVLGFAAAERPRPPLLMPAVLLGLIALTVAPLSVWVVSQLFEETITTLFVTAALASMLLAWRRPGDVAQGLMTFLLLGAACAAKTQSIFFGGIGIVAVIGLFRGRDWRRALPLGLAGCALFAAVGAVPYLEALSATGNPFFPFSVGEPPDTRWIGLLTWDVLYGMVFHTARYMETRDGAFGFQHLLLFPLLPLAGLLAREGGMRVLALVLLLFCAAMLSQSQYARYLYYAMPGMLLLLPAAMELLGRAGRPLLLAGLAGACGLNMLAYRALHSPPLAPAAMLQRERFSPRVPEERRIVAAINATHGAAAQVYFAGLNFTAGLQGRAHTVYSPLRHAIEAAGSPAAVEAVLRAHGVTHVVTSTPRNMNGLPVAVQPQLEEVLRGRMVEMPLGLTQVRLFVFAD